MKSLFLVLIYTISLCAGARETVEVKELFMLDSKLNIENPVDLNFSDFTLAPSIIPRFSFNHNYKWIWFDVKGVENERIVIQLARSDLNEVIFYLIERDSLDGHRNTIFNKHFVSETDVFPSIALEIDSGTSQSVLIRLRSNSRIQIPIEVLTARNFETDKQKRQFWYGIFVGLMVVMILYNLFIFLSTNSIIYIFYVLYVSSVFLTQSAILGIYQNYFPLFGTYINSIAVQVFTGFVGIAGTYFAFLFLKVDKFLPNFSVVFKSVIVAYFITVIIAILGMPIFAYRCHEFLGAFVSFFFILSAILVHRNGYRPAKFFLLAWLIFLTGIFVYVLREYGLIGYSGFSTYLMPVGSALETILLSFALADRINTLKKEKEQTQLRMYDEMKKNRDIIRNQKNNLEKMVVERTHSLAQTNSNLQETLDDLKATQSQLVDAEKMASLGQLTAGIAHEINNPINFVSSNIAPLKQDIQDLLKILEQFRFYAQRNDIAELNLIEEKAKELDLEYSITEINDLMNGIEEGAHRTSVIVNSLRSFSRSDEESFSVSDINIGIQSTLTILKSEIGKITLTTNFGDIPKIDCYPGKLNQVFMNLIDNALHAVKSKYGNSSKGIIEVNTYFKDSSVWVEVSDNGYGIEPELIHKVFDPFFTTKEVGKGTGLGLSISYGIVENHSGTITVESVKGISTTFKIQLPTQQNTPNV